ncbi:hypothetical protein BV25DRAFT_895916 [Artomyces pyxidatus]|uniref:Uncharacterized protein n=1 Tax=Artomyces pyxidatus TaxID=48021 RepID=A0ACB8THN8_9AGAM|nr:hypothetical protein BV25DRAFT_895916 [Artomyces pyxidatus]
MLLRRRSETLRIDVQRCRRHHQRRALSDCGSNHFCSVDQYSSDRRRARMRVLAIVDWSLVYSCIRTAPCRQTPKQNSIYKLPSRKPRRPPAKPVLTRDLAPLPSPPPQPPAEPYDVNSTLMLRSSQPPPHIHRYQHQCISPQGAKSRGNHDKSGGTPGASPNTTLIQLGKFSPVPSPLPTAEPPGPRSTAAPARAAPRRGLARSIHALYPQTLPSLNALQRALGPHNTPHRQVVNHSLCAAYLDDDTIAAVIEVPICTRDAFAPKRQWGPSTQRENVCTRPGSGACEVATIRRARPWYERLGGPDQRDRGISGSECKLEC